MGRRSSNRIVAEQRASTHSARVAAAPNLFLFPRLSLLSLIEDRRLYDPSHDYRRARGLSRLDQSVVVAKPRSRVVGSRRGFVGDVFSFKDAKRVAVCLRRKERREVMFAKRKTGKGSRAPRRRNYYSSVSCR